MKTMKVRKAKGASWMKRILPMVALVAAGLMTACDKNKTENDDPYADPIDPVKVLSFGRKIGLDSISYDNVMKYANDPRITKIIYFVDSVNNNDYTGASSRKISELCVDFKERLDYTPKATGSGTFIFAKSQLLHEDSVWFVANGWKIKHR
ncbi:MAG: hypothetical protein K2O01_03550 [Bacteroidales bacterium]|nr:hypothetical protein [Bacteroidales bacterium]